MQQRQGHTWYAHPIHVLMGMVFGLRVSSQPPEALQGWVQKYCSNIRFIWKQPRWINSILELIHEIENNFNTWSDMLTTAIFYMWQFPQDKHSLRHFHTFLSSRIWFSSYIMPHEPCHWHWIFVFHAWKYT